MACSIEAFDIMDIDTTTPVMAPMAESSTACCDYALEVGNKVLQQGVLPYTPKTKRPKGLKDSQGAVNLRMIDGKVSSHTSEESTPETPSVEIYEDVRDIFAPQLVWWKTKIQKDGLQKGETHAPTADCSICDMIYSNVSSSFVEALLSKEKEDIAFVYQLKNEKSGFGAASLIPEAMVSVWLEAGDRLLPMVKLKVSAHESIKTIPYVPRAGPRVIPKVVESTHTGSDVTLALAAFWIKQCDTHHPKCTHLWAKQSPYLPTRLIDVGTLDGSVKPHLWIPENGHKYIPYITLSYRWGKSPTVLLTQASLPTLCEQIPLQLLPQTNQDAIKITRFLGIRYLWIDALCIIQDLDTDWQVESENMGNIYHNSYCTISASMAATGERGCFMDRRPLQARLRPFVSTRNESSNQILPAAVPDSEGERQIVPRASAKRAEAKRLPDSNFHRLMNSQGLGVVDCQLLATELRRRLAKRPRSTLLRRRLHQLQRNPIMKFAQEISRDDYVPEITIRAFQQDLWASEVDASPLSRRAWTLQERILSARILHFGKTQVFWECQLSKASETWPQPASKTTIDENNLSGESKIVSDSNHALSGVIIYPLAEHWHEIVQLYTDATLTRAEDKLVAISGVAKQILKGANDAYFAGLWRSDFIRSLLWHLKSPQRGSPTKYRAPTWSWAAVDGRVEFLVKQPRPGYTITALSNVQTISTTGVNGKRSSTGQIKDGFCCIWGPTRAVLRYERFGNEHRLILNDPLSEDLYLADFFPDVIIKDKPVGLECLPLLFYHHEAHVESENYEETRHFVAGLVIQPTGDFRDEYRRIGIFRISEKSATAWFADFDVREVTLV
ncbi:HET-domain-containing protein [Hyaloscypha variabilis F]|uniref:HET-domain-containing protein n=1 Tax=Hyaloscypha variabilis (strain UAMH 11265 / GT02V1 / F) TaxID=1149755 RepID=A0A2J6RNG2_HYAVF|nr:HET-domain-containing protein [Hyaloscypha variabilis F]